MSTKSFKLTLIFSLFSVLSFSQTNIPNTQESWQDEIENILESKESIKSIFHDYTVDHGVEIFNLELKITNDILYITSGDYLRYEVPINKIKRASLYKLTDDLMYVEIRVKNRAIKRYSKIKNIDSGSSKSLKIRIDDALTRKKIISSLNDLAMLTDNRR